MRTLYEAASAIEAHMLVDLLKREGMTAHIHGEALQGAIGELPAAGLIRLVIDEPDYERARAVIGAWESEQPAETWTAPPRPRSRVPSFIAGLAVGVLAMVGVYWTPVSSDGTDIDRDGQLDETWTYAANGRPLKFEVDRNLDHKIDYVVHYDRRGLIQQADADDNFDGVFETQFRYRNNEIESAQTDTDGDGYPDLRAVYANGVQESVETLDPRTGRPVRVEHFKLHLRTRAEVDSDRDGTLDQQLIYSPQGEVTETRRLPASGPSS
jgi:hypothetical protein